MTTTPHWITSGKGPGILFIHGAGGNAAVWWQQLAYFSKTHHCVAYDLPGFGRTPKSTPETLDADFSDGALAAMDAAGLEKASIVTQSLGGWAGLRLALRHPDRVERLILGCTMAGIAHPPAMQSFLDSQKKMDARGPASVALGAQLGQTEPAKEYLYQQLGAFNTPFDPAMAQTVFGPQSLIPVERLSEVRCPVIIFAGENDAIWPPSALEGLVPHFPDAHLHIFKGCGHSPYFEIPDEYNSVLGIHLTD
ncbi:MAG: alpha/beta hydrolase [Hyphomonas sp.]|nr:alpha/beta hydrolase [Hyphomonas sp.]